MGYLGREDGLMIELQRIRDERALAEKVLTLDELMDMGQQDDGEWAAIWTKRGYDAEQCECLRSAFANLEGAWLVFWESGDPDRALWRLVDAAGLLAEVFPERSEATGRGYRIEKVRAFCQTGHRWGSAPAREDRSATPRMERRRSVDPPQPVRTRPVQIDPRRAFSRMQKAEIFIRSNGHCGACGVELGDVWEADPIVPHAWGGLTEVRNGPALCVPCNQRKRDNVLTVEE